MGGLNSEYAITFLGILHEWMRTQMLARLSSNLLQRTGGDYRGGRAQPGLRTFMMTCLRWILGYMRLEIWRKIGLSGDRCLCAALYALVAVHAALYRPVYLYRLCMLVQMPVVE